MPDRPNILLILSDEHHPDVAGFAGDVVVDTCHIDRLAERSARFSTAICANPVCTPSRMCLLTGKEAHRCAAWSNHWIIYPEHVTWPRHFATHGYTTALVGKMHFGGRDQMQGFQHRPYGDLRHGLGHQPEPLSMFPGYHNPESAGVTEIPESLLQDVVTTRETLAFLFEQMDHSPDRPWFVCASYGRPHSPLTAPGRYIRRYRDRVPPVELSEGWLGRLEPFARLLGDKYAHLTADQSRRGREGYYACVDFVDDCIGELLDGLERAGALDNTVVIYTSDHGEMMGQHGLWGKGVYFEPSIAVPLLFAGPGVDGGGRVIDEPFSLLDLLPTCCALAGLPIPEGLDGVDWSEALGCPEAPAPRQVAPSEFFFYGSRLADTEQSHDKPHLAWRAVRDRRWKYVDVQGGEPLLFDLENDPQERCSLAGDAKQKERCRQLREVLFENFSWEQIGPQLDADRARLPKHMSGLKPTTPNQYMLPDGRIFDAEGALYEARWLAVPDDHTGGIIPQQFG